MRVCVRWCRLRLPICEKLLWQRWHWCGRSPVWVRMCRRRSADWVKRRPQHSQPKGRRCPPLRWCCRRASRPANTSPHTPHWKADARARSRSADTHTPPLSVCPSAPRLPLLSDRAGSVCVCVCVCCAALCVFCVVCVCVCVCVCAFLFFLFVFCSIVNISLVFWDAARFFI